MLICLRASADRLGLLKLLIANLFQEQREQLSQVVLTLIWQCFPGNSFVGEQYELFVWGVVIHGYLRCKGELLESNDASLGVTDRMRRGLLECCGKRGSHIRDRRHIAEQRSHLFASSTRGWKSDFRPHGL